MAVYERKYRGYDGALTPQYERFTVIPRYAFRDVFKSKLFTSFFSSCMFFPLLFAFAIYIQHNLKALANLPFDPGQLFPIDAYSFYWFMNTQGMLLGFIMLLVVGPPLISQDLRNNALPLYLGRPFSPAEYILGKLAILGSLLSLITWIPGLLLFALAAYFKGWPWLRENASVGVAILAASMLFILFMSLLTLALSAWAKWKPLTSGLLIGFYVVSQGFASALNNTFETVWGDVVSIPRLLQSVWMALFSQPGGDTIPAPAALFVLALMSLSCLALLQLKVRPHEIVR